MLRHNDLEAPVRGMLMRLEDVEGHMRRVLNKPCSSGKTLTEYFCYKLPKCIDIPTHLSQEELVRWKLSREVFQEIFLRKTDRIRTLDEKIQEPAPFGGFPQLSSAAGIAGGAAAWSIAQVLLGHRVQERVFIEPGQDVVRTYGEEMKCETPTARGPLNQ